MAADKGRMKTDHSGFVPMPIEAAKETLPYPLLSSLYLRPSASLQ
jgi:hypothetical protein